MITQSALDQLAGMKHIRYTDQERDEAWQFMLLMCDDLLEENKKLRLDNDQLRKKEGSD